MRAPSVAGVVGWGLALFGFVVGSRPLGDNSLFTHIATGRLIVSSGIPRRDPYSFTAPGEPWVVQSWLVSTCYGAVERLAGLGGIRVIGGLLVAVLLALVWHLSASAGSLGPRLAIMAPVIAAGHPFWTPRPLLLGLVLLGLVLVVVGPHGADGADGVAAGARHDPRTLVPIMWMWVNAHGSFVLGPLVVGCLCLGRRLDGDRRRSIWRPLAWSLVGTAAGAVNPLGPSLLVFPLHVLDRMEVLARVVEWHSPDFAALFARAFLVEVALAVVVLVRRPSYTAAVPLVVFVALALLGQRSVPHAGVVLVPGLATGLAGLGRLTGGERSGVLAGLAAVLTVAAALVVRSGLAQPDVDLRGYPAEELSWLEDRGVLDAGARVAAEDTTGNLIELRHGTAVPVFFDDRYDMFPLGVSRDYLDLHDATTRWEEVLDRYHVGYLLWSRSTPLASLVAVSPRWRVVHEGSAAFVACRRGGDATLC